MSSENSFPWTDDPAITDEVVLTISTVISDYFDEKFVTAPLSSNKVPHERIAELASERTGITLSPMQCQRVWRYLAYGEDIGKRDTLDDDSENESNDLKSTDPPVQLADPFMLSYSLPDILKKVSPSFEQAAATSYRTMLESLKKGEPKDANGAIQSRSADLSYVLADIAGRMPVLPRHAAEHLPPAVQSAALKRLTTAQQQDREAKLAALEEAFAAAPETVQKKAQEDAAEEYAGFAYRARMWQARLQEATYLACAALDYDMALKLGMDAAAASSATSKNTRSR